VTSWVQVCTRKFSLALRRHHCRCCGRLVCAHCSPESCHNAIPEFGYWDKVRQCKDCYSMT
jgi:hypothetical protein